MENKKVVIPKFFLRDVEKGIGMSLSLSKKKMVRKRGRTYHIGKGGILLDRNEKFKRKYKYVKSYQIIDLKVKKNKDIILFSI